MLTHLSIQGLAIIDSLEIDFGPGFNVITGETGAGKSILIRALNLLLGGKASPDMVRSGASAAVVTGDFALPENHDALMVLSNFGIPFESGETVSLIVRRSVGAKGKSQAWINDVPVTSQALRELGKALIDIFGQHENQRLLEASKHLTYIDAFLKDPSVKRDFLSAYSKVEDCVARLSGLAALGMTHGKEEDFLRFRLKELKAFSPSPEDYETHKSLLDNSKSIVAVRGVLERAMQSLERGDTPLASCAKEAAKVLAHFPEESADKTGVEALRQRLFSIASELEDVNYELSRQLEEKNIDESAIEQARERVFGYQDFFRKHGAKEPQELVDALKKLETDLDAIENLGVRLQDEFALMEKALKALSVAAKDLRALREKAMSTIRKAVEAELADLAMVGAKFDVEWRPVHRQLPDCLGLGEQWTEKWSELRPVLAAISTSGGETAEFLLSANRGEALLPLAGIASGGELSRIMLALKKALAADAETCVLVFDEIDTGISGRVADTVGNKMRELANGFQVICISHLPQVAVYADRHYLVEKQKKGDRTETRILSLSEEESAEEIARLLSGAKVTEASLKNARHLKSIAHATHKGKKGLPRTGSNAVKTAR